MYVHIQIVEAIYFLFYFIFCFNIRHEIFFFSLLFFFFRAYISIIERKNSPTLIDRL